MKIGVCVKQVPETTEVKIDPETKTLVREGIPSIVNPFDLYAVEEGLRIKEQRGGTVTALSMGPPQAADALRETVAMGADEGVLVTDRALAGSDTLATSLALAAAIRALGGFDLILCGKQAIDGDTAQVGPGIAEWLDIPHVAFVRKINTIEEERIEVEIIREEGSERVRAPLPCLLTVVKEINEPRLPSLRGKIRAKSCALRNMTAAEIGLDNARIGLNGSPTWVMKVFTPPQKGSGIVHQGEPEPGVDRLLEKLKELQLL